MKKSTKMILSGAIAAILLIVVFWLFMKPAPARLVFQTQAVTAQDLALLISSTGTVEPEELVNVGSQVNGMITKFGVDADGKAMDYGSKVKSGQLLAQIDDALYQAEYKAALASREQALAAIASAKAGIEQSKADSTLAQLEWARAQKLKPQNVISQSDYDTAYSAYEKAKAVIQVSEAVLVQAQSQLASADATLEKCKRNLDYCVISSPVDGVIIDRRVNVGQTVVSSMSASSLFLIARDLKKMQVWVSVNEADIGSIKPGLPVTFTVDAFPGRVFTGEVLKVRLNATMSQNVVTYVVEIATDNADGTLLPYLTANVKFIVEERNQVLAVSNAALRYTPSMLPRPDIKTPRVFVLNADRQPELREVETGLNNGKYTEIVSGLNAGEQIITGEKVLAEGEKPAASGGESPFLPKPPQHGKKK